MIRGGSRDELLSFSISLSNSTAVSDDPDDDVRDGPDFDSVAAGGCDDDPPAAAVVTPPADAAAAAAVAVVVVAAPNVQHV